MNLVEKYLNAGLNVMLEGPVGSGKTAQITQLAANMERKLFTNILSTQDAVDGKGMPSIVDGQTVWNTPDTWPQASDGPSIIFFDEMDRASQAVLNSVLTLCYGGFLGTYKLPEDCLIIACINGSSDTGTKTMSKAVYNRFVHIEVTPDNHKVANYLSAKGYDERLISFVDRTHDLFTEEVLRGQKAFPTPRSIEMIGKILPACTPDTMLDLVTGIIGQSAAFALQTYFALADMLPDITDIISNPDTATLPVSLDAEYFVTGVLTLAVKTDITTFTSIATYAKRLSHECNIVTMQRIVSDNPMLKQHETYIAWALENKEVFTS